tara:strand:- start:1713 stop:2435 length:723 start_codon:yes stop_codon:yes gene_type:complete
MVKLPDKFDPTLEALKTAVENEAAKEKPRTYIGASGIGFDCSRKIWYGYNGYKQEPRGWICVAAAEDGHRSEDLYIKRLRMVEGIELHTEDENGEQYGFDLGFFQGHYDGIIRGLLQCPETWHIWEHKAMNDTKFKKAIKAKRDFGEELALKNWDMIYYCQAILYMYFEEIDRHYMTISTAGGRDVISIRTKANPKLAKGLIEKAKRIHKAKEAPDRMWHKEYFECKWCDFYTECYKGEK